MTIKEIEIQLALGTLADEMKWSLVINKRTSKKILTILSTDENVWVKWRVAYNTNTPKEVLTKLSKDKNSNVRCNVAENPNTPKEILKKLSMDKNKYIGASARHTQRLNKGNIG